MVIKKEDFRDYKAEKTIAADSSRKVIMALEIGFSDEGKPRIMINIYKNNELQESYWGLSEAIEHYNSL